MRGEDIRITMISLIRITTKVMIYNPLTPRRFTKMGYLGKSYESFPWKNMLVMWILTRISVGKSYLIVTALITNSGGERDRIGRRRVFDFETGNGVAIQGGVDKDDKQNYERDYFSKIAK